MNNKEIFWYMALGALAGIMLSVCAWGIWDDVTHSTIEIRATHAELQRCIESDAPMWSDAWCQDCYGIWYEITERR